MSTIKLLKLLHNCELRCKDIESLYEIAKLNRIAFFYLYKLIECGYELPHRLKKVYEEEYKRFMKIQRVFAEVSRDLSECGIDFAVFKSVKPYPSTTVDIDIIVFNNYKNAIHCLISKNYRVIGYGPDSITFESRDGVIKVDLYREIAISRIRYLDKELLKNYVKVLKSDFGDIKTLCREADLIAIAGHVVIKEQMYTLADYFTIINIINECNYDELIKIAKQLHMIKPLTIVLDLTDFLHRIISRSSKAKYYSDLSLYEINRLCKRKLSMPHKLHPFTISSVILEKFHNESFKYSIALQLIYTLNPKNMNSILREILRYITRKTY